MFSRLFGSKKKEAAGQDIAEKADWSFLGTDMHSHLIPGIDDGAAVMTDSLGMIRDLRDMGFTQIVTTPHIKSDHYKNNPEIILAGLETVRQDLKANAIDISINAAAEYYVDDIFMEMLEAGPLLTVHKNEVLIEFSFMFEPMNLYNTLFKIQTKGYKPIIAHPERYLYFHQKPEVYSEMRDRGCLLQLNALSVLGYYGKREKEIADKLLEKQMYDYCGTDMHHIKHAQNLANCGNHKAFQALRNYPFQNKNIKLT
ncbi:MAG: hypothetical protein EOP49_01035 [Sphingobacteriales bacterium]|nr:MAG: hypothetical protein EOP49_01035 [Sphingobacteriales bacterium]